MSYSTVVVKDQNRAITVKIGSQFPKIPLMALTATATPSVRDKLTNILRNPIKEIASINRPNTLYGYELTNVA